MNFLFPGFLFALVAVAVPIVVHLFNLRKFKKVYFSNVRFLKSIQEQTSSSQRLKERLILATRILAITFLVFAFAKPFVPAKDQLSNAKTHVVSIYVDNSYSMEAVGKEGTLLEEAKRRALEIVSAYGQTDRFQLVTNDFEGRHQRLLNPDAFKQALDEVHVSSNTKNLKQLIDRQEAIFSTEPNASKSIYLISDFQKNILGGAQIHVNPFIDVRLVRVKANPMPNLSIDSAWFSSPLHRPGQTEKLLVKVSNNSDQKVANVALKLIINEQQKALGSGSIAARGSRIDTLSFGGLTSGWQQGEVNLVDNFVTFDDRLYFSFNVREKLRVLAINGSAENKYIRAVYQSDPFFDLGQTSFGNVNYAQLSTQPMLILNQVSNISTGLVSQLKNYVEQGGTLCIFPSLDGNLEELNGLLGQLRMNLGTQIIAEEAKVAKINLQHPLFKEVFEHIPQNLDLPVAKKYLQFSTQSKTNRQSLLELIGGKTFLDEYRFGKGRIFISAVPLDDAASNFVRHSIFVPMMYQIALSSLQEQRLFYTLGQDQALMLPKLNLKKNQSLVLRKSKFEAIPDVRSVENASQLFVADQIKDAGNYQLRKADSLVALLAFNYQRSESDLTYASNSVLESRFGGSKVHLFDTSRGSIQSEVNAANQGLQLWKWSLLLALLFLAAEVALIRFYKIAPAQI